MCEMQKLKFSVEQILTAAAQEICALLHTSLGQIEEELREELHHNSRRGTDVRVSPKKQGRNLQEDPGPTHIKEDQEEWISLEGEQAMKLTLLSEFPTHNQTLWTVKEELQDRSLGLDQVDPEPPQTKEEENLWTNGDREQLRRREQAGVTHFPFIPAHVKSEYDEDQAQSSQFHPNQTEEPADPDDPDDYGGSETEHIQNNDVPTSDVVCETAHHRNAEDDKTVNAAKTRFSCSVCNKAFFFKSKLNDHMLVHTREKPFSCSLCRKGFALKGTLTRHMSVHTGVKPFRCSVCNKDFTRKNRVKEHMLVHTREKPFSCPVCNRGFAHKWTLKKHMLVHTGEKPFTCSLCNKGFAHKHNLENHVKSHRKELSL